MRDKNIYIWGAIVAALAIGIWAWSGTEGGEKLEESLGQETVFENREGEKLTVSFDNQAKTALVDGLPLIQVESASGVRYVNEAEGLELWNKGIEVTLKRGETLLFQGRTTQGSMVGDPLLYVFAGPTWVWYETQYPGGASVYPQNTGKFTISFDSAKGQVSGNTDCNGFSGEYTSGAANTLSFKPFVSTLMYCEGSQEKEFIDMVMNSDRYIFSESGDLVLVVKGEAGLVILKRQ